MRIALLGLFCLGLILAAGTAQGEVLYSMPFAESEFPAGSDLNDHASWNAQYDTGNDQGWPVKTGDIPELPEGAAELLNTSGNHVTGPRNKRVLYTFPASVNDFMYPDFDGQTRTLYHSVLMKDGHFYVHGRKAAGGTAGFLSSGMWWTFQLEQPSHLPAQSVGIKYAAHGLERTAGGNAGSFDVAGDDPQATKLYLLKIELSGNKDKDQVFSRVHAGDEILSLDPNDETTANWFDHGATNDFDFRRSDDLLYMRYSDQGITLRNTITEGPIDEIRFADNWASLIALPEPTTLVLVGFGGLLLLKRRPSI